MKRVTQAFSILIVFLGLLVMAGYTGTDKGAEQAPVEPAPAAGADTTARSTQPRAGDAVKGIRADLNSILETSKLLVEHGDIGRTFSQLGAVLALNDNPDPGKNTLARFMRNALGGLAANADIDTVKGLLLAVAAMDRAALTGQNSVSQGLIMMMERNMYGQPKAQADVKTSSLRSLLFMLQGADVNLNLKVFGLDTHIPLLYFVDSPDHPAGSPGTVNGITKNVAGWAIGEIATARRWGREGKIRLGERFVPMDQFQALDWVFYKKRYHFTFLGMTLMKFDGLAGMLSNKLVRLFMPAAITDAFPALLDLAGGMSAAEYNGGRYDGFTSTSWKDRYGTAGKRHRLFALFGPIMEYYWNAQISGGKTGAGDMVALLAGLNEIDPAAYRPLTRFGRPNPRATFRETGARGHESVVRTLEDSGLLTALLKGGQDHPGDMLAPALDLAITITRALSAKDSAPPQYLREHPDFTGSTLMDVVFFEWNLSGKKPDRARIDQRIDGVIAALFEKKPGETKNTVAKVAGLVQALAKAAGDKAYLAAVREDLVKIIQAAQNLMNSQDIDRLLPGLDKVLALNDHPDPRKNSLAGFLNRVLRAAAPVSDGDALKGLLRALLAVDRSAMEAHGITEGIIYMAHHNMYAQRRETADINVSQLRSFFFLVENVDRHMPLTVNGQNTGIDLIKLIDSPDHPPLEPGTVRDQTTNLVEWYIGEIVTAVRWGREGKIMLNGRMVAMDQYQAYDWMFFKKRYQLTGMGRIPLKFTGVSGILTNEIVQSFLPPGAKDTVITLAELAGGMSDAEYAGGKYTGFTPSSWKGRYGTGGRRHKVMALFNPIMEFFWNARDPQGRRRTGDFVRLIRALNEIPAAGYQQLFHDGAPNPQATLRHDDRFAGRSVIKTVEDNQLLRIISRSHGPNDNGILAPGLDLLILIIAKLDEKDSAPAEYRKRHPDFSGNTVLDVLFHEARINGLKKIATAPTDPIEETIKDLFAAPQGEPRNAVAKLHGSVKVLEQIMSAYH